MIFVSTGTVSFPFKRLVDQIIHIYTPEHEEGVIIQSGAYDLSSPAPHIIIQPFFPPQLMVQHQQRARLNISAAGEFTIFQLLVHSKNVPILVPRLHRFQEHVDDQQLTSAQVIHNKYSFPVVVDITKLENTINQKVVPNKHTSSRTNNRHHLVSKLIKFTDKFN